MEFKPGDIVIVKPGAKYGITVPGTMWRLVYITDNAVGLKHIPGMTYNNWICGHTEIYDFDILLKDVALANLTKVEQAVYGI